LFKSGGTYRSWIHEAFSFWDPKGTGKILTANHLQGIAARLGVHVSLEEAAAVLSCFDEDKNGQIKAKHVINSFLDGELNIIADKTNFQTQTPMIPVSGAPTISQTQRAPRAVSYYSQKIKTAVEIFVRKSKGSLEGKDILYGTFLRWDHPMTGRVDTNGLIAAVKELGVNVKAKDLETLLIWFDTDGSRRFDYRELLTQLFGKVDPAFGPCRNHLPALPDHGKSPNKGPGHSTSLNVEQSTSALPTIHENTTASPSKTLASSLSLSHVSQEEANAHTKKGLAKTTLKQKEASLIKEARKELRRTALLEERKEVKHKLESVERQRKKIIEDYRDRHAKAAAAANS
jgi:Ca2+-binding EF-hand superfamily protein